MFKKSFVLAFIILALAFAAALSIPSSASNNNNLEMVYFPSLPLRYWWSDSIFLGSIGGFSDFLKVDNNLVFLGKGNHLLLLATSPVGNPQVLAEVALPGTPSSLQVAGKLAYVTVGYGGLIVLDISQPQYTQIVGLLQPPGFSSHVLIVDNFAYLSTSEAFLTIDVSVPNTLSIVNTQDNPSSMAVMVGNNVVYGDHGVHILDVTNPKSPIALGECCVGHFIGASGNYGFTLDDSTCYPLNCTIDLSVIEISDPLNPHWVSSTSQENWGLTELLVDGDKIYFSSGSNLEIFSIQVSGQLNHLSHYETYPIVSLSIVGDLLYIGTFWSIDVLNVREPSQPNMISSYTTSSSYASVQIANSMAYGRTDYSDDYQIDDAGLQVIDFSTLSQPVLLGEYPMGTGVNAIKTQVETDALYLVGSNIEHFHNPAPGESIDTFITIYDIENPQKPATLGTYNLDQGINFPELTRSFQIQDEIGYIHNYQSAGWVPPALEIVDFHDPAHPILLTRYSGPFFYRFRVIGSQIYMLVEETSNPHGAFQIYDVSNAVTPTLVSTYTISPELGYMREFDVSDSYAYIGIENTVSMSQTIHIVDISDPKMPELGSIYTITHIETTANLNAIEISGDIGVIGFGGNIQLVDLTDPLAPEYISSLEICGSIVDIQILGDRVYLACRELGAQVIDISNPNAPKVIQEFHGMITGMNTGPDLPLFVSAFDEGLLIHDHNRPTP